jgi:hypothetical protein
LASKKTLNIENLERLGTQRLAALVMDVVEGNAEAKRKCRLALAAAQGSSDVAHEVNKRLNAIRKATSYVGWEKRKKLTDDLNTQLDAIINKIATHDAKEATELLWRFMTLAESIFARCDDGNGTITAIFDNACQALGTIAVRAKTDASTLAEQTFQALLNNSYYQYDHLIPNLAQALGNTGLNALKQLLVDYSNEPLKADELDDNKMHPWQFGWILKKDFFSIEQRRKDNLIKKALSQIAESQQDIETFIALHEGDKPYMPMIAAEIAKKLYDAGRIENAWLHLNTVVTSPDPRHYEPWVDMRLTLFKVMGKAQEAQAFRWECFEQLLNAKLLREYLDLLPDFEDVAAEKRAMQYLVGYPDIHKSLAFLLQFTPQDRAKKQAHEIIMARYNELDGNNYELLPQIATWLESRYPISATLCLRTLIDYTLDSAKSKRYRYASNYVYQCQMLLDGIDPNAKIVAHDDYVRHLKQRHKQKYAFWDMVG